MTAEQFFDAVKGLKWRYKWQPFACLMGWHQWSNALDWLSNTDSYCDICWKDHP